MDKIICGLDIGTNSVGWCLTNENNHIIRKKDKALWGVRLFDEASDAKERRLARNNRRRLVRRRYRINLLRSFFDNEINKVDDSFFYRLDNSFYHNEDREIKFRYTLFNDRSYDDKKFFSDFKTIYHLRKHLIKSNKKEDIRFIYLALHHMIKYRGNFLHPGDFEPSDENDIKEYLNNFFIDFKQIDENYDLNFSKELFNKLNDTNNNYKRISEKKEKYNEILNSNQIDKENKKLLTNVFIPLMLGNSIKLKNIKEFDEDTLGDIKEISAQDEDFDDKINALMQNFTEFDYYVDAIVQCKNIYQFFLISNLLSNTKYLSVAMVNRFDKHKKELDELKDYIKHNCKEKYNLFFRDKEEITIEKGKEKKKEINNYVNYIGSTNSNNVKKRFKHACSKDLFYKFIKDQLNLKDYKITEDNKDSYLSKIMIEMENGTYLLRQNESQNSVYPYQLNLMEMEVILSNQSKFYPFLNEKDEYGTVIDKIISLLTFKIPYYVGPLIKNNDQENKHGWVIRKSDEKIYPWNFDDVIDKSKTAECFINRMRNKCTYVYDEYCLPKNSIIFSYFNVLQYLNKIYVNNDYISYEDKMSVIKDLFMNSNKKITIKSLKEYFKSKYGDDVILTTSNEKGLEEINCSMSSYVNFVKIFGKVFVHNNIDLIEDIIKDIVIFEDKKILEYRLKDVYGIKDEKTIKEIKKLNYTKYSNLSKKLLIGIKYFDKNGEQRDSILKILEKTNLNLQEALCDEDYNFKYWIDQYNQEKMGENKSIDNIENYVEEMGYLSSGYKRALIQAYKICDELEKIVGKPIDEYYVECTRSNKNKKGQEGRTKSRYQYIKDIYNSVNSLINNDYKEDYALCKKNLSKFENDEDALKSDKIFLYFIQMGRDMYTGETIDLNNLKDYDIDHIVPQSLIKDDSIENRVLVKKTINAKKSDTYPIDKNSLFNGDYNKAYAFYKLLEDCKLIGHKKVANIQKKELSEKDLESFVNRQLVYTNQAVKGLINAINYFKSNGDKKPKIVYSKSENVSDFRNKYDLYKSRELNNFHHAHDAYLNIVVGRAIDTYFSYFGKNKEALKEIKLQRKTSNPIKIFDHDVKDIRGNLVWTKDESIKQVKRTLYNRYDILTSTRTYLDKVYFGKVTIYPADDVSNIPVKTSNQLKDVNKYGGLKEYKFGSYALIKNNNTFILESIPTLYQNNVEYYLSKVIDKPYKNFEIIIDKVKINTIIEKDNKKICISGKTGNQFVLTNKKERYFGYNEIKIAKKIEKLISILNSKRLLSIINNSNDCLKAQINYFNYDENNNSIKVVKAKNDQQKDIILSNQELDMMYEYFKKLLSKDIYSYSSSTSILKTLTDNNDKYQSLLIIQKAILISNLLDYLKCNERKIIDLSLIGGSKNSGVILISNKLSNCTLYIESITGFYRKVLYKID